MTILSGNSNTALIRQVEEDKAGAVRSASARSRAVESGHVVGADMRISAET